MLSAFQHLEGSLAAKLQDSLPGRQEGGRPRSPSFDLPLGICCALNNCYEERRGGRNRTKQNQSTIQDLQQQVVPRQSRI